MDTIEKPVVPNCPRGPYFYVGFRLHGDIPPGKPGLPPYDTQPNPTLAPTHELQELYRRAMAGDKDAAEGLYHRVFTATTLLSELARKKPELLRDQARQSEGFPAIVSYHREQTKDNEEMLEILDVGAASILKARATGERNRLPSHRTPAIQFADSVLGVINENRLHVGILVKHIEAELARDPDCLRRVETEAELPAHVRECTDLPDFTVSTVPQWLKVGWGFVMEATKDQPELNPVLRRLGESQAHKGEEGSATQAAYIRAEIKQSLKEAMLRLAPPS